MKKVNYKKLFEKLSLDEKVRVNQPRTYKLKDSGGHTLLALFCSEADLVASMNVDMVKEKWQRALELDSGIYVTASDYPIDGSHYQLNDYLVCPLSAVFKAENAFSLNLIDSYQGYVKEVKKDEV